MVRCNLSEWWQRFWQATCFHSHIPSLLPTNRWIFPRLLKILRFIRLTYVKIAGQFLQCYLIFFINFKSWSHKLWFFNFHRIFLRVLTFLSNPSGNFGKNAPLGKLFPAWPMSIWGSDRARWCSVRFFSPKNTLKLFRQVSTHPPNPMLVLRENRTKHLEKSFRKYAYIMRKREMKMLFRKRIFLSRENF